MIRTTSTPSKLEQQKALLGGAVPVKAPGKKSKPSKAESSVTTFAVAQDITDVATVEQQIEQHAQNIERIQRDAIIEIGRELSEAQSLFKYTGRDGGFTAWLSSRLPHMSQSAAYRAIDAFKGIDLEMFPNLGKHSDQAVLEIAKAEPDVKAIIAERVAAGEVFTAAQVKEIKAKAAEEAIAQINSDAQAAREELAALRKSFDDKDIKSAAEVRDLQQSIVELTSKLKGYEAEVEKFKKSLPKPSKAKEQAKETGAATLASDGKYYSGATEDQKRASDAFLSVFNITADLTDRREPAAIVAIGCPADSARQFVKYCDAAIAYLTEIKENLHGQQP